MGRYSFLVVYQIYEEMKTMDIPNKRHGAREKWFSTQEEIDAWEKEMDERHGPQGWIEIDVFEG